MMIKRLATACILACCSIVGTVQAALIDRGGGLIYDTDLDITWLQDTNYAKTSGYDENGNMSWDGAMTWADQLVYAGYSDWQLPNYGGPLVNGWYGPSDTDYLAHLFYNELGNLRWNLAAGGGLVNSGPFVNLSDGGAFWTSTPSDFDYGEGVLTAWWMDRDGYFISGPRAAEARALVFRYGDSSPVAVPEAETYAMLLAGLGLLGVFWLRNYPTVGTSGARSLGGFSGDGILLGS